MSPYYGVKIANKTPLNDFVSRIIGGFFNGNTAAKIDPATKAGETTGIGQEMVNNFGGFVGLDFVDPRRYFIGDKLRF